MWRKEMNCSKKTPIICQCLSGYICKTALRKCFKLFLDEASEGSVRPPGPRPSQLQLKLLFWGGKNSYLMAIWLPYIISILRIQFKDSNQFQITRFKPTKDSFRKTLIKYFTIYYILYTITNYTIRTTTCPSWAKLSSHIMGADPCPTALLTTA